MYGFAIQSWTLSLNHPFAPRYSGVPPLISVKACKKKAPSAMAKRATSVEKVFCVILLRVGGVRRYRAVVLGFGGLG